MAPNTRSGGGSTKKHKGKKKARTDREDRACDREPTTAELLAKIAKLEKESVLHQAASQSDTKYTKPRTFAEKTVAKVAKTQLSTYVKFINSDKKLVECAYKVMDKIQPDFLHDLEGEALQRAKIAWASHNKTFVGYGLNEYRNYVQGELRAAFLRYKQIAELAAYVPDPNEIKDCALRALVAPDDERELTADEKKKLHMFYFYVEVLVGKAAGYASWSTPKKKFYTRVSESVSASSEAFVVAVWENCYPKWMAQLELIQAGTYNDLEFKAEERELIDAGKPPKYPTKFTDATIGASKWGGWLPAGRMFVRDLTAQIQEVRKMPHVEPLEEHARVCLHAKAGRPAMDAKRRRPKGKKRALTDVAADEEEDDGDFDL